MTDEWNPGDGDPGWPTLSCVSPVLDAASTNPPVITLIHPLFPSPPRPLNYPSVLSLSLSPWSLSQRSHHRGVCTHTVCRATDVTLLTSHVVNTARATSASLTTRTTLPLVGTFFLCTLVFLLIHQCLCWEVITINRDIYCNPFGSDRRSRRFSLRTGRLNCMRS